MLKSLYAFAREAIDLIETRLMDSDKELKLRAQSSDVNNS